jgi:NADH:ubiquinone oxidoreductase subunit
MHHTVDKTPDEKNKKKYLWQKEHTDNKTGTNERYKPIKIKRDNAQKKYETWK